MHKETIMFHNKKLALFISHIYGEYQSNLCKGIIKSAEEYGYLIEVYATSDGENLGDYSLGEESILDIPNFDEIDGVIFASDTYTDKNFKQKILELLKSHPECKVVEISEYEANFPNITMDNNSMFGDIASHMITEHSAKKLCYLGDINSKFFSDQRQNAFRNAIEKHNRIYSDDLVYNTDGSRESLKEALKHFTKDGTELPDAILCYNDSLAIEFWMIAEEMGYQIPDDFAITGCDCSDAGANIIPSLTSISFPTYELGECALKALVSLIQGKDDYEKKVCANTVYGGSCGCTVNKHNRSFKYSHRLQNRISVLESSMFISMNMSAAFSHVTDIDEGMELLEKYILQINECDEFYLCLYSNWDSPSQQVKELTGYTEDNYDDDSVLLKLGIKNGKRLPDCSFSKKSLLPSFAYGQKNSAYIVSPLFFENRVFGYLVLASKTNDFDQNFRFVHWIMNITQLLENLCEAKSTALLTKYLENMYMSDILTGLYNNHGFISKQEEVLASASPDSLITAFIIDMDNLKLVNDNFGHKAGDFALKAIGQAISSNDNDKLICARFTGDEFYCLGALDSEDDAKDFLLKIDYYLNHFNKFSNKPYNISVSSGYSLTKMSATLTVEDLDKLFEEADAKMYEIKKSKIKNVIK